MLHPFCFHEQRCIRLFYALFFQSILCVQHMFISNSTRAHTQGEILLRDTGGARLLLSGIHFPHLARSFLFANWLPSHLEHLVTGTGSGTDGQSPSSSTVCIRQGGARQRIVDANGTVIGVGPVSAPCQDASGTLMATNREQSFVPALEYFSPSNETCIRIAYH